VGYLITHEKLVLAGGTAFPGGARLTCFLGTGWKAGATDLTNFSDQIFIFLSFYKGE
jgi:hypothetical protein